MYKFIVTKVYANNCPQRYSFVPTLIKSNSSIRYNKLEVIARHINMDYDEFKNIYVTFAENKDYFFNRNRICFKKFDDALTITNKLNDIIEPLFVLAKLSN